MAHKADTDSDTSKTGRGKVKAMPAIDLPAAAVVEVKPDIAPGTTPTSEASTEPAEAAATPEAHQLKQARPSKLAPALIGLIAGAVGGFGAYHLGEFSRPKALPAESALAARLAGLEQRLAITKPGDAAPAIAQAVLERLDRAEAALANAGKGQQQLGAELGKIGVELGKLGGALGAEVADRKKAIDDLGQQASTAAGRSGLGLVGNSAATEIEGLKSRLGSIEALQPKIESVTKDVLALSGQLSGLVSRDALGAANARLAAVSLLEDGFARGRPLSAALDLLKNLGSDAGMLATFAPFAASGAPDSKKLLEEFRLLASPPAAVAAPPNESFLDRVKNSTMGLVEVRRTGDVTGTDDAANLARAEQALQRGDISSALGHVSRLSASRQPAYANWRLRSEARLKAVEALSGLRGEAVAALAKAAAAAK